MLVPEDWSVLRLLRDVFSQLFDVDSRLLRSLRWLVTRPGGLAAEYFAGRRNLYLRPLQLFVLANIAYFFIQSWALYSGYNTPLESQINYQVYSSLLPVESWAQAQAAAMNLSFEQFEVLYDIQSDFLARSLIFLMVPVLALVLALLFAARRTRMAEHLVVAAHYYAFELLVIFCVFAVIWPFVAYGLTTALAFLRPAAWALTEFGSEVIKGTYWYLTLRRYYGLGRLPAVLLALVILMALMLIVFAYRLALLWATLLTV